MNLNRAAAFVLGGGLFLTVVITLANYFALSNHLRLEPVDRLQTSIDVFIASITAIGVLYAGLNLRMVSNAQTETKSMHETRYLQGLLDEWNLNVERSLQVMEQEGIANRSEELLKLLWFFEKVAAAMRSCVSLRNRLFPRFSQDYWNVRRFLERNQVLQADVIPARELADFEALGPDFSQG